MKIGDIERVNHLVAELEGVKELIAHTEKADAAEFELFIKLPGDSSIRMSSEGAASAHYAGFTTSAEFLARLKRLAIEELNAKRKGITSELATLGVEV
jgi:hypothetical protein